MSPNGDIVTVSSIGDTRHLSPFGDWGAQKIKVSAFEHLPCWDDSLVIRLVDDEDDVEARERYDAIQNTWTLAYRNGYGPTHHLLGHPRLQQHDMREQCQLVSNGYDLGAEYPDDARALRHLRIAPDSWTLLMELGSARRRFDRIWNILQC